MKTILLIAALFIFEDNSFVNYRKLTWEDYQAVAPYDTRVVAETETMIELLKFKHSPDSFYYTPMAIMVPEHSFTRTSSQVILSHEQGHFDIAEISANYLRMALRPYQFRPYANAVDSLYELYVKKWEQSEKMYDEQTDNGQDKEAQERWDNQIKLGLKMSGE